jgi:hypothetical protein
MFLLRVMRLTKSWAMHNVLEGENKRLAATGQTGNGRRNDINERTEKQIFGNNKRM